MRTQEATQIVDNWVTTYQNARGEIQQTTQQAKAKALQVSDQAAEATPKAGIFGLLGWSLPVPPR